MYDLDLYFKRIGMERPEKADTAALFAIHEAHTLKIPFENLDPFFDRDVSLAEEALQEKILKNNRGGYCFEMNAVFSGVLTQLGYKVQDLICRSRRDGGLGMPLHRAMIAESEGKRWFCDVGFGGDGIAKPVLMEVGLAQEQNTRTYRIMPDGGMQYRLEILRGDAFAPVYAFDDKPAIQGDFELGNFYTSKNPNSGFRRSIMVSRPTETGRISVFNTRLREISGDTVTDKMLTLPELNEALRTIYGLEVEIPQEKYDALVAPV